MTLSDIAEKSGLNEEERILFDEYTKNRFEGAEEITTPDTSFLTLWERIVLYAEMYGADMAVNDKICPKRPVSFNSPGTLSMKMYDSAAGRIPVIYVRDTDDFEQLVTNVAYRGVRPESISQTGASFIHGAKTRLIILSAKPYSNVPANELGLEDENDWAERSLILRQDHECTHYFTRQTYGITNNILHDEIMADLIGMYEAFGFYRAEWFLRFMGIIPGSGNRSEVYTKGLPENVCRAVHELAVLSANGLERWSEGDGFKKMTKPERIKFMCKAGLEGFINL